jgi:hypothetical protein
MGCFNNNENIIGGWIDIFASYLKAYLFPTLTLSQGFNYRHEGPMRFASCFCKITNIFIPSNMW